MFSWSRQYIHHSLLYVFPGLKSAAVLLLILVIIVRNVVWVIPGRRDPKINMASKYFASKIII